MKLSFFTRICSILLILFVGVGCSGCKRSDDTSNRSDSNRESRPPGQRLHDNRNREAQAEKPQLLGTAATEEERFVARWSKLNKGKGKNSTGGRLTLAHLVQDMSGKGYIEGALKMIHQDFGEGEDRNLLIMHAFHGATVSLSEIEPVFYSLESKNEKQAAIAGLARNMAARQTLEGLEDSKLGFLGDRKEEFIKSVLRSFASYEVFDFNPHGPDLPTQTPEEKMTRLDLALSWASERGYADVAKSIITDYGSRYPFKCFDMLQTKNLLLSQPEMEALARKMVAVDPQEAVTKLAGSSGRDSALALAIRLWANRDRSKALQWYSENNKSLTAAHSEAVASGFAKHAAEKGNFEDAREWTTKIGNPDTRRKAEGDIRNAERTMVHKESTENPLPTLQKLISGESKHADHWIEEAMITWISKEPEKAEEWYRKNWDSLPAAKSQYVAAAYAREALRLGDPVTARQWTKLIEDPKTRTRIIASIDKAKPSYSE